MTRKPGGGQLDRFRQDIQERLEQLRAEGDKLRRALAALDPRERSTPRPARSTPRRASAPTRSPGAVRTRARTAPGETKGKVLAALANGDAMTAGEVATATGLNRGTVSTMLSKCVKTGEVLKAERGYRLPERDGAATAQASSTETAEPATKS